MTAVFETQRLDRAFLQALANYQLNRTPKHAQALRHAAEMNSLVLDDLDWDGNCQVATGLCIPQEAPDAAESVL